MGLKFKKASQKVRREALIKLNRRYKGYYIDYRLTSHFCKETLKEEFGFARVGIHFTYRHHGNIGPKAGTIYDEKEEKIRFLSWIEKHKKMIKTRKYDLPVNYDELEINQRRAVRLQYIAEQSNQCQYCEMPLNEGPSNEVMVSSIQWDLFPKGFQKHPIHLHHNHDTGMTIGAVHMRCNAFLWVYKGE